MNFGLTSIVTLHDGDGNIVRSIDILAKKEYNYEYEEGKIVRATEAEIELSGDIVTSKAIVNTVKYYYDTEGKMTKKVLTFSDNSTHTVHYENSDDNTVVKFSAGGRTVTSHSKADSFGRKVFDELQLGTDFVSRQFIYHAGKVTAEHKEKAKVKSSATTQLVSQIILSDGRAISYDYDNEERIIKVDDTVDGIVKYTYDALGQLETETKAGITTKFKYDNYGNITAKAKGVIDENGEFVEESKISYVYGNDTWKDLLTSYNGQKIEYDAQGNPTSYLGHTLTWEKGRQLKRFVKSDETVIDYTYNANGIRTSKTVDGVKHTYTLDGTKILRETWDSNTLIPLYDNEDGVCGILYNNIPYYFIKNLQGDVIAIVDKDAQTVARYSYDSWGVCTVTQDSVGIANVNPFRYRSYYYDEEIELYYLQSRYYDAKIGRFINADMAAILLLNNHSKTKNLFDYCQNSPINSTDAGGNLAAQLIARIIIGIIIGFLVQVISDLIAIWFAKLFGKREPRINAGDYLSSMLSWALTCVSFSRKSLEFVAVLLPVAIKHIYRVFNRSFDWISLAIDMALAVITILVSKQISKTARNKLNKIIKKAGTGNKAYNKIRIGTKRLNLKVGVWGIKLNLGINISNFFVSNIYSFLQYRYW